MSDMWPTPAASERGLYDGEVKMTKSGSIRRQNEDGSTSQLSLEQKVLTMWPTATVGDSRNSRNRTANRSNPSSTHSDGVTLVDAVDLFSSQADSPASHSAPQEAERARKMTATSGRKWCALLTNSGPLGYLVRTLMASSRWTTGDLSTRYLLTWTASGTRARRSLFRLAVSERHTDDTASGLWPTARTRGILGGSASREMMTRHNDQAEAEAMMGVRFTEEQKSMWATASARDYKDTPGMKLEGTNPDGSHRNREDLLPRQVYGQMYPTPRETEVIHEAEKVTMGRLNPDWVETLMGYPMGWTDIHPPTDGPPPSDRRSTSGNRPERQTERSTEPTD